MYAAPIERALFFSSRRRHTRLQGDWSSVVCSSDLNCRVHRGRNIGPGNCQTLFALNAQAHYGDLHGFGPPSRRAGTGCIMVCLSKRSKRSETCFGPIGVLPSCSHAMAAATDPRIDAISGFWDCTRARVAYASRASPSPTASTTRSANESIVKNDRTFGSGFRYVMMPRSPNFKIKYLHDAFL